MKNLFNNLSQEEKTRILELHSKESEVINEQLGSKIKAAAQGLGARVGTIAQNVGKAVAPNKGERIISSPKLNAALARTKSRTQSLQKLVDGLDEDLNNILTIANEEMSGQFKYEAEQIKTLVDGYKQTLATVKEYNKRLSDAKLQAPTLQAPTTTQPASTQTSAPTSGQPASPGNVA
jgi:hypothetical protein